MRQRWSRACGSLQGDSRQDLLLSTAERQCSIAAHPKRCSWARPGQHIPPGLMGGRAGSPHFSSARNPELRIFFQDGKSYFQQSDLCFAACWCHTGSLEERSCSTAPSVCFCTFWSGAQCPALPRELCSVRLSRLRTLYKEHDTIFLPTVVDKSQSVNFGFTWQSGAEIVLCCSGLSKLSG